MNCGDQVVNSMSEIHVPVSVDTNLDVNKNSSGHLLNNNTTHIFKESNMVTIMNKTVMRKVTDLKTVMLMILCQTVSLSL